VPILTYAPETRGALGVGMLFVLRTPEINDSPPSRFDLVATYSLERQIQLGSRGALWFGERTENQVVWSVLAESSPFLYFGTGSSTSLADEDAFTRQQVRWSTSVRRALGGSSSGPYLGLMIDGALTGIEDLDTAPTGASGGLRSALGLEFTWDRRDRAHAARTGTFLGASILAADRLFGSEYDYGRFCLDGRVYGRLYEDHTLAGRLVMDLGWGDVPFYDLPMLGGPDLMRGTYQGRYRARSRLAGQLEYRSPQIYDVHFVAFVEAGTVADTPASVDFGDTRVNLGLGARYEIVPRLFVRLDGAVSRDRQAVYLSLGEAF